MTEVSQAAPAATPSQAERLAGLAYTLPPELWHLISAIAEYIQVECAARKVGASERAAKARVHQLALLGLLSATTADPQGDAYLPGEVQECLSYLHRLRCEALGISDSPPPGLLHAVHSPSRDQAAETDLAPWDE